MREGYRRVCAKNVLILWQTVAFYGTEAVRQPRNRVVTA